MNQEEISFTFQNCRFKKIDIASIPYNITNLKIINSRIESSIFNLIKFNNLTIFNLDNNKMDSDNFENIFRTLLKHNQISKSLKVFSAKKNCISRVIKNENLITLNNKFSALDILNLSNNIICDFNKEIMKCLPNIKILDLSNNSLIQEHKCKEIIENCKGFVLLLRNIGIMKESINKYYIEYLSKQLSEKSYPYYSFNIDSLFYKRNYELILNINLANIKKSTNLLELNCSSCNIDDQSMINIINNCCEINNNISKINLSFNLLTENFLDSLIKNNLNILLNKVKKMNLSFNLIHFIGHSGKNFDFIYFLNHFQNLETLLMKGTPLEDKFNEYIKKEVTIHYEIEKKGMQISKIENELLEIKNIIEQNKLGVNPKFCLIINDILSSKYAKKKEIVPKFFEHIIIDDKKE